MTVLYNMGPHHQWRFSTAADHDWMQECRDDYFDKKVQGETDVDSFTNVNVTGPTNNFIWQYHDHYPDETVDFAYFKDKHGMDATQILEFRENSKMHLLGVIFVDRATGNDIGWVYFDVRKFSLEECTSWNVPDSCAGKWFYRNRAIAVHPDFRGQGQLSWFYFMWGVGALKNMKPWGADLGGHIIQVDPWDENRTKSIPGKTNSNYNKKMLPDGTFASNRLEWHKSQQVMDITGDANTTITSIPDVVNSQSIATYGADKSPEMLVVRIPSAEVKAASIENGTAEAHAWWMNCANDLSLDPDTGKLYYNGPEQDETKTVRSLKKAAQIQRPNKLNWADENFY